MSPTSKRIIGIILAVAGLLLAVLETIIYFGRPICSCPVGAVCSCPSITPTTLYFFPMGVGIVLLVAGCVLAFTSLKSRSKLS